MAPLATFLIKAWFSIVFALLISAGAPAHNSCLVDERLHVIPTICLPNDAVSVRKVLADVTTLDGTHYNHAVFEYKLITLRSSDDQGQVPHLRNDCKTNQGVALVRCCSNLLLVQFILSQRACL